MFYKYDENIDYYFIGKVIKLTTNIILTEDNKEDGIEYNWFWYDEEPEFVKLWYENLGLSHHPDLIIE